MNVDQADAIDNLMKQGFTRVQAIKIFYEQSLAKYYKKQYHGDDNLGFDQTGLVKNNVQHFNALEQSHLIEKPINILGRRFSKPGDPGHVEGEEEHYDGLPPHHPRTFVQHSHSDGDGDRSPSPLSLDSCFKTMPQTGELPHDIPAEIVQTPAHVPSQDHFIASSEEKYEIKAKTVASEDVFPTVEFENEVKYEEEDSLCGPDPTISNVAKFLSSCDFTTEEKQEFFFLLSQGMNIDEASDRIYHQRLERSMNTLPPAAKGKLTQEVLFTTINYDKTNKTTASSAKSVRPRYPLRLHGFSGIRDDDLQMLLDRGYTIEQAQFLCDFFYENGLDFFQKFYAVIPEVLGDRAPFAAPHNEPSFVPPRSHSSTLSINTAPTIKAGASLTGKEKAAPAVIGDQGVAHIVGGVAGMKVGHPQSQYHQFQQPVEEEDIIVDAESVTADTLVQLKRLKTFARGGFKSNFSIENNCAVSEHEALKLGLIVSQQEADYGINMYDALMPSDEQQIEKLIRTGLTLDEAILKVFESRFGKTKLDTSALSPTNGKGSYTILKDQSPAPVPAPVTEYEAADKLESEIALLMMSGYTREKAVKILLERKKKEQQESSHPSSDVGSTSSLNSSSVPRGSDIGGMNYPSLANANVNSSPQRRLTREPSQERMEREALMSQLPPSAQRRNVANSSPVQRMRSSVSDDRTEVGFSPALNLRSSSGTEAPSTNTPNQRFNSEYEAMIHHQLSMDPFSASRGTHSTSHHNLPYIPGVDTRRTAAPTQAYDTSAYGGGGAANMRTPTNYRNPPSQGNYNSPDYYQPPVPYPTPIQTHQPPLQQPVSHIYRNEEYRNLRDIPSDEKAFRIGVLISQQETNFGTNMYQSIHTADAGEMTQLIARGYNEDEAALMLFERKFGRTPPVPETMYVPQQQRSPLPPPPAIYEQSGPGVVRVPGTNSNGNHGRSPVRVPSSNSMPRSSGGSGTSSANRSYNNSPTIVVNNAYAAPPNSVGVSGNSPHTPVRAPAVYAPTNTGSPSSAARRGNPPIPPSQQQPHPQYGRPNIAPTTSQQNMRRIPSSHQQTTPPPVGMMNPSDISDIHPNDLHMLIGMGFSQFQAIQALRLKNYNVQLAAEYLLEH